jgi:hypothetical protein
MEKVRQLETGIPGNRPDDFPATLLPDYKGITLEEREQKYWNWTKTTLISKVAALEKQIEDDDIANRESLARNAQKIADLEAAVGHYKEEIYRLQCEQKPTPYGGNQREGQRTLVSALLGKPEGSLLAAFNPEHIFSSEHPDGSLQIALL